MVLSPRHISFASWKTWLLGALLLACAWRLSSNVEAVIALRSDDEAQYILNGARFGTPRFDPQWGPLYSCWYRWLCPFLWPADAYFFNWRLTTALPPLGVFLLARRLGAGTLAAWLAGFFVLITGGLYETWPRVNHFALGLFLLGAALASGRRSRADQLAVLTATALICAYVRPEFMLAVFLLGLLTAGLVLTRRLEMSRRLGLSWLGIVAGLALLTAIFGFPLGGGRSDAAFRQHFAAHWKAWTHSPLSPWFQDDLLFAQAFGEQRTFVGALKTRPDLVARHVEQNLADLVRNATWQLTFHQPLFSRGPAGEKVEKWLLLAAVLGTSLYFRGWRQLRECGRKFPAIGMGLGLILIPTFITIALIGWRGHYVLILYSLFYAAWARSFPSDRVAPRGVEVGVAVLGLALIHPLPGGNPGGLLTVVDYLTQDAEHEPVKLLEFGHIGAFLDGDTARYDGMLDPARFASMVREGRINRIAIEDPVRIPQRWQDSPDWQDFLAAPESWGFQRETLGEVTLYHTP